MMRIRAVMDTELVCGNEHNADGRDRFQAKAI